MDNNDFREPAPNVVAAESKLEKLTKADWVTEAGTRWLMAALDPFHDAPINVDGLPDNSTGLSVVKKVLQTIQIQPPAGLDDGDTWDCSVISWPELNTYQGTTYQGTTGQTENRFNLYASNITNIIGGVTYASVASGATTLPATTVGSVTPISAGISFLQGSADVSPMRAIARAFEVANTTADIYKQGTVYCWQVPAEYQEALSEVFIGTGGSLEAPAAVYGKVVRFAPLPPKTLEQVSITMDSRMWEASKGCYCVSRADADTNYVASLSSLNTIYGEHTISPFGDADGYSQRWATGSWDEAVSLFAPPTIRSPFNLHGAYFTGLSKQTSLTLRAVAFLEVFPPPNSELVTLATPSCPLDSNCLDLYSESIRRLPVGVPFNQNPLGEWFEDVVNTIAGAAAPALGAASMIFPEFAPILAPLGAGVGAFKDMVLEPRAQRRKQKRKMKKQKNQLQLDQAKLAKDNAKLKAKKRN